MQNRLQSSYEQFRSVWYQSPETAHSANNAAEAAEAVGDTASADGYKDVAKKAANRVASFDPDGKKGLRSLLPKELDAKAEPDPNFGTDIKSFNGNGASGGSDTKPSSGSDKGNDGM